MAERRDHEDQQRRTVKALELMGESWDMWQQGQKLQADEILDAARRECGHDTVTFLAGGMRIGEIPEPGSDEWDEYLAQQQDALARNEEAERAGP